VRKAFVAAGGQAFYQPQGIDERALIRAFIGNLAQAGARKADRRLPSRQ